MYFFKQLIAKTISEKSTELFSTQVTDQDVLPFIEYPPDPSMGDLALPCFKLSRTLRRSPVQIAISLSNAFSGSDTISAEALNGYLNLSPMSTVI